MCSSDLDLGVEAQLAASFAGFRRGAKIDSLRIQQGLVEGREVEALRAVLLGRDVSTSPNKLGLADITQLLDLGEEFCSGEHGWKNATPA